MVPDHLSTYLNDHLAGAVAALEMLPHVAEAHGDILDAEAIRRVEREVREDRSTLESLMQQLGVEHHPVRRAAGWLAERLTRLKMVADDPAGGTLRAFETIELISLGIEGKISLWMSLSAVAPGHSVLSTMNYSDLIARARNQRALLEPLHATAARAALRPDSSRPSHDRERWPSPGPTAADERK